MTASGFSASQGRRPSGRSSGSQSTLASSWTYPGLLVLAQVHGAPISLVPRRIQLLRESLIQVATEQLSERLGQVRSRDAVRHDVELVEEELVEASTVSVLRCHVGLVAANDECERRVEVDADLLILGFTGPEHGTCLQALVVDALLLFLDEFDAHGFGVGQLQKLAFLTVEPGQAVPLQFDLSPVERAHDLDVFEHFAADLLHGFGWELDASPELLDETLDQIERDVLQSAAMALLPAVAEEVRVDAAVPAAGVRHAESAAAQAAGHGRLEIVRVLPGLLALLTRGEQLLDSPECRRVDQWLVRALVLHALEPDYTDVVLVGEGSYGRGCA